MMNVDFVSFDLAVKLKEKGFDWTCMAHFNTITYNEPTLNYNVTVDDIRGSNFKSLNKLDSFIDAPTISQVLKWLREEKKIFVDVNSFPTYSTKEMVAYAVDVRRNSDGYSMENVESAQSFARWEEAALAGIEYVLDNLI